MLIIERTTEPHLQPREGPEQMPHRGPALSSCNFETKQDIMQLSRTKGELFYKDKRISIFNDYSAELLWKKKDYDGIKRELAAENITYSLMFPTKLRVTHERKTHIFYSVPVAASFLHSIGITRHSRPKNRVRKNMQTICQIVGPRRSERQKDSRPKK